MAKLCRFKIQQAEGLKCENYRSALHTKTNSPLQSHANDTSMI